MEDGADTAKPAGKKQQASTRRSTRRETAAGTPALPGEECRTVPHERWSEAEKWVWGEICAGRIADFNKRYKRTKPLNPNSRRGWSNAAKDRRLSPAFLEAVLLHEPWRSAIPRQGVRIDGALFSDPLDLAHARLPRQLWLDNCRFESVVNFADLRVDGWLSLKGSSFEGAVNMNGLQVAGGLFMGDNAAFKGDVRLIGASVGGQLGMGSSTFEGAVNMYSVKVANSLFMTDKATFKGDVILRGASVGGQLGMGSSTFEGAVHMDDLNIASGLFMGDNAAFKGDVILRGARIGAHLAMDSSTFEDAVDMEGLEVAEHLFMRDGLFRKSVFIVFARLGAGLALSGAEFGELDLSGTSIAGELQLGSRTHARTRWRDGGRLVLRNTHAGAVQDRVDGEGANEKTDAWPAALQLDGFTYGRLGGFAGTGNEADMLARDSGWYIKNWLERDPTYSPQPYEQLADVFRAAGHTAKAHDILYASRERERWEASGFWKFLGLSLLKWTIGYGLGIRYFRALVSVSVFVVIGAALLWAASYLPGDIPNNGVLWNLSCSLDLLLPIVELNPAHSTFVMKTLGGSPAGGWMIYYFYVHKLFGWLLASFLVAGLAGLTQK